MKVIFKTWKKATYFKGTFGLRDKNTNWAAPIEFPIVFIAYGAAIKGGNWQSSTAMNTPDYVIEHYFDTIGHSAHHTMGKMWFYCKQLENVSWNDISKDGESIQDLIKLANDELYKLKQF